MKRKLSLLLAAVMVAAMVPVTAFAKTDNSVSKVVTLKKDGYTQSVNTGAPYLQVDEYGVAQFATTEEFLLTLDGAQWKIDEDHATIAGGVYDSTLEKDVMDLGDTATVEYDDDTYNVVLVNKYTVAVSCNPMPYTWLRFPILAKVTGETATVTVTPTNNTVISASTHTFANTTSAKATAKAGDMVNVELESEGKVIEPVTITETVAGALESGKEIKITLHGEYTFVQDQDANGTAWDELGLVCTDPAVTLAVDTAKSDSDELYIDVTGTSTKAAIVSISGIKVKATKDAEKGDVAELTVSGAGVSKVTLEVAKAVDYSVSFTAEDKDLPVFYAGRKYPSDKTLKVTFKELAEDSWWFARKTTLTFPEGVNVIDVEFGKEMTGAEVADVEIDKNVVTINGNPGSLAVGADNKAEWTAVFFLSCDPDFTGEVTVTAGGPSLAEDITATVAEVVAPVTFEVKGTDVSIDYRNVPVGDIVIKETAAGAVKKNTELTFYVDKIALESGAKFEVVAGDIDKDDVKIKTDRDAGAITVTFKKETHKTPFEIKLSEVKAYLDRSLPVGDYYLKVKGNAIFRNSADDEDIDDAYDYDTEALLAASGASADVKAAWACFDQTNYTVAEKYISVITAARDQDDSSFTTKVAITIGASEMVVGQKTLALEVPAYIADGYTMLPVRAVADALSQDSATILWDDATKTVTIAFGARIISMTIGSDVMNINGVGIKMNKAPEITAGRTFLPLRDLGYALGLTDAQIAWDDATSTATLN